MNVSFGSQLPESGSHFGFATSIALAIREPDDLTRLGLDSLTEGLLQSVIHRNLKPLLFFRRHEVNVPHREGVQGIDLSEFLGQPLDPRRPLRILGDFVKVASV